MGDMAMVVDEIGRGFTCQDSRRWHLGGVGGGERRGGMFASCHVIKGEGGVEEATTVGEWRGKVAGAARHGWWKHEGRDDGVSRVHNVRELGRGKGRGGGATPTRKKGPKSRKKFMLLLFNPF